MTDHELLPEDELSLIYDPTSPTPHYILHEPTAETETVRITDAMERGDFDGAVEAARARLTDRVRSRHHGDDDGGSPGTGSEPAEPPELPAPEPPGPAHAAEDDEGPGDAGAFSAGAEAGAAANASRPVATFGRGNIPPLERFAPHQRVVLAFGPVEPPVVIDDVAFSVPAYVVLDERGLPRGVAHDVFESVYSLAFADEPDDDADPEELGGGVPRVVINIQADVMHLHQEG